MGKNAGAGPQEMARLLDNYGDALYRHCLLVLKNQHLAQDAAQDTLLRAYQKLASFRGESSEKTWLLTIATNVCKNYMRAGWWRKKAPETALEALCTPSPEEGMAGQEVLAAVLGLPTHYRQVVVLFYYQQYSLEEIGQILGAPKSTVGVRLSRARKQLAGQLKGWFDEE